jgi:hypothetical protein
MGMQVLVGHPLMPFLNDPVAPDHGGEDKARMRFAGDSNTYSYVADTIAQNVRQHLRGNLVPYNKRLAYKAVRVVACSRHGVFIVGAACCFDY